MKILLVGPANGPCAELTGILGERGCHVVQVGAWAADGDMHAALLERLLQAHRFRAVVRFDAAATGGAAIHPEERPLEALARHRVRQFVASPAPEVQLRSAAGRMLDDLVGPARAARTSYSPYPLLAA